MSNILIYSNAPFAPSGYGTQTAILATRLRDAGHNVAIVAFHGLIGSSLTWNGITVYPGSTEDQWTLDLLPGYYQAHKADLLITLMDAWVLDPGRLAGMNVAHWLPVDCSPLGVMDRRVLDMGGARVIAMSEHGRKELAAAGYDPLYVPHSVDPGIFYPLPDRDEVRKSLGLEGRFVIGINAANQDPVRKGFSEQFAAYAALREEHPEALLLVHTRMATRNGTDLGQLCGRLGITESVMFAPQLQVAAGISTQEDLRRWYGILDVLSNCSYGEGFGLAALEAQACGTPVVTTDFSAMSELAGPGWRVPVDPLDDLWFNRGHNAWWARPKPSRILAAYEDALAAAGERRGAALEFASRYQAATVMTEFWKPALKELCPPPAGPPAIGELLAGITA